MQGSAYWQLTFDSLGVPTQIWILPSQNVTPRREPESRNIVDYYEYRTGSAEERVSPSRSSISAIPIRTILTRAA